MAFLADSRLRALDANGDPLVGATLTIYDANTTTPTAIFSDAALTVPLSNPTSGLDVSDAGGWFPQIFAADGTVVDITLKNSGGSTIKTYVDVPFVGEDVGDFTRTVSGSGRFKVTGSAGEVSLQFGDPDPDDTGGTATLEGWGGTQLDSLTLDSSVTNTSGRFTENGKDLPGVVQTESTAFSAATAVDIPLTESPDGVRAWKVTLFDLTASSTAAVWFRFSYDSGATFKSGAADYGYANLYHTTTTPTSAASTGAIQINVASVLQGTKIGLVELTIITPDSGSNPTLMLGSMLSYDGVGSAPSIMHIGGYGLGGYGRATHLRMTTTGGGTFTGKYRVERLYGFGEA